MRTNQRHLVRYFKQYHIDYANMKPPSSKPPKSVKELTEFFNPEEDVIDKRILYEITGRKKDREKFSDEESDSDQEDSGWTGNRSFGSAVS